jgi:hypothetical protein
VGGRVVGGQESARALGRRLNYYAARGLLVIDEIGYLSYEARAADLLFQVVSRRYERRSLVLTTHLPFSAWPTMTFTSKRASNVFILPSPPARRQHLQLLTIEVAPKFFG